MHADEVDVDVALVRRLLRAQFPQWAELPIEAFEHGGTDHFIFRLGDELQARPRLRPHLPVDLPEPLACGEPAEGYPFTWGIYRWLPGEPPLEASATLARDLADFLHALQHLPVE